MKISKLTLIASLLAPLGAMGYAQSQTGSMTPGTTPTGVLPPDGSVAGTQIQTSTGSQINTGSNAPAESSGGVFGPSKGAGIFGPTDQATTDNYGIQQVAPGTNTQGVTPGVVPQGPAGTVVNRRGVPSQNLGVQPRTDASGNPLPLNGQTPPLPRDLNPLPPQAPAGTFTGR